MAQGQPSPQRHRSGPESHPSLPILNIQRALALADPSHASPRSSPHTPSTTVSDYDSDPGLLHLVSPRPHSARSSRHLSASLTSRSPPPGAGSTGNGGQSRRPRPRPRSMSLSRPRYSPRQEKVPLVPAISTSALSMDATPLHTANPTLTASTGALPSGAKRDKRYYCPVFECQASYARRNTLIKHFASIHSHLLEHYPEMKPGDTICPVPGCGAIFARKGSLVHHYRRAHPDQTYNMHSSFLWIDNSPRSDTSPREQIPSPRDSAGLGDTEMETSVSEETVSSDFRQRFSDFRLDPNALLPRSVVTDDGLTSRPSRRRFLHAPSARDRYTSYLNRSHDPHLHHHQRQQYFLAQLETQSDRTPERPHDPMFDDDHTRHPEQMMGYMAHSSLERSVSPSSLSSQNDELHYHDSDALDNQSETSNDAEHLWLQRYTSERHRRLSSEYYRNLDSERANLPLRASPREGFAFEDRNLLNPNPNNSRQLRSDHFHQHNPVELSHQHNQVELSYGMQYNHVSARSLHPGYPHSSQLLNERNDGSLQYHFDSAPLSPRGAYPPNPSPRLNEVPVQAPPQHPAPLDPVDPFDSMQTYVDDPIPVITMTTMGSASSISPSSSSLSLLSLSNTNSSISFHTSDIFDATYFSTSDSLFPEIDRVMEVETPIADVPMTDSIYGVNEFS